MERRRKLWSERSSAILALVNTGLAHMRWRKCNLVKRVSNMVVEKCLLSSDVYFACMNHALSTEVEEIMGLLIGWTQPENRSCYITHTLPLKRSDKRKDRVEISPEVLSSSITVCERLNEELQNGTPDSNRSIMLSNGHLSVDFTNPCNAEMGLPFLRVVGWYHSHPHITVFPSEVDLRTQEQYQMGVDPLWIGLIFGVYHNDEASRTHHFQHIAFQSVKSASSGRTVQHLVPIVIVPKSCSPSKDNSPKNGQILASVPVPCAETVNSLLQSFRLLMEEAREAFLKANDEIVDDRRSAGDMRPCQLFCIYHKNLCKLVTTLAGPLNEMLLALSDDALANRRRAGDSIGKRLQAIGGRTANEIVA